MRTRLIVVPILVEGQGRVLLCRMSEQRGVFPGQWALPGGGVEPGERIEEALRREVREELGVELSSFEPLVFKDAVLEKSNSDGTRETLHMVFLIYSCSPESLSIVLNSEFSEYLWATASDLRSVELSTLTRDTLRTAGLLEAGGTGAG